MREPEQIDIYYTAAILIEQCGEGAMLEAMKRQEMYAAAADDAGGERIWADRGRHRVIAEAGEPDRNDGSVIPCQLAFP